MTHPSTLDLFSGIGGLTLALAGVVHPLAYCDVDASSRAVLLARMRSGQLPTAPICHDVKLLNSEWLRERTEAAVDIIMGGFPCVGFSPMGLRTAFADHDGSGLFNEIVRLTDELQPHAVFLENVPGVLTMGMHEIVDQLSVKRGYDLTWCVVSASDVDAPQFRRRWFCLATRPTTCEPLMRRMCGSLGYDQPHESYVQRWATQGKHVPRMVVLDHANPGCMGSDRGKRSALARARISANTRRLELLGNSVVPDAVRAAFRFLAWDVQSRQATATRDLAAYKPHVSDDRKWPLHGHYIASTGTLMSHVHGPPLSRTLPFPRPVVYPAAFKGCVRPGARKSPAITSVTPLRMWSTPRYNCPRPSCSVTARTIRDLATQLRFERDTPDHVRSGHVAPEFVEWIMGYPIGWTKCDSV